MITWNSLNTKYIKDISTSAMKVCINKLIHCSSCPYLNTNCDKIQDYKNELISLEIKYGTINMPVCAITESDFFALTNSIARLDYYFSTKCSSVDNCENCPYKEDCVKINILTDNAYIQLKAIISETTP